jgi:DNA-binding NtrC family response regulator
MASMTPEKTCLIVDDEPSIRAYLKAILLNEQFQALEADNAPQAFRLVQKLNGGLDLIVTDVKMPGDMDGVDLAYAIRQAFPQIPVVVVSGYPSPEVTRTWTQDFAFIQKPFKPEAILTVVKTVTAGRRCRTASG